MNGDTGDIAVDQYHRYPQDVAMMASSAPAPTASPAPGRGKFPTRDNFLLLQNGYLSRVSEKAVMSGRIRVTGA